MTRTAVMFGAGNVGRGFLGQLFSESGYEVVFVDVDEPLIAALNDRHSYTIHLVQNDTNQEVRVAPVRALNSRQIEAVSNTVQTADIAATAVGARILPMIAPLVAAGVVARACAGVQTPLNIIICENLKDAAASFRQMVRSHIPAEHLSYFETQTGFVDTVIGRMVPPPTPEMRAADPALIAVEPYKELPVDRRAFIGAIPVIAGMEACDNFAAYTARKLYIHNCGHATLAYLGYRRRYEYGYQALEDAEIRTVLDQVLAESVQGVVNAYQVEAAWLEKHIADLLYRFTNRALGDTIFRLARDPLRKLAAKDRLVGAARLAECARIQPQALSRAIAAGFAYDDLDDPMAVTLQQIITNRGLAAALEEVSGLLPGETLTQMVTAHYQELVSAA